MKLFIYSYDEKSESAALLKKTLIEKGHECLTIKHNGSTFKGGRDKLVLNWGSSDLPREVRRSTVINAEGFVADAIDKITCLTLVLKNGGRIPTMYTDKKMIDPGDFPIVCRTKVKGADGAGIVIAHKPEELVDAKLYVKLMPSKEEYRITIHDGEVLSSQIKVQRRVDPVRNAAFQWKDYIRVSSNNWGFDVANNVPANVKEQAIAAVKALGLDFGGVDVIWDGLRAYVLEVNTASQLTPYTAGKLADSLINKYNQ